MLKLLKYTFDGWLASKRFNPARLIVLFIFAGVLVAGIFSVDAERTVQVISAVVVVILLFLVKVPKKKKESSEEDPFDLPNH